jgi:hypothetical protein
MRGRMALASVSAMVVVLVGTTSRPVAAPKAPSRPTAAQVESAISHAAASAGLPAT